MEPTAIGRLLSPSFEHIGSRRACPRRLTPVVTIVIKESACEQEPAAAVILMPKRRRSRLIIIHFASDEEKRHTNDAAFGCTPVLVSENSVNSLLSF